MNARDDGFKKCAYCSTKLTTMWRSGPNGHGTLCNSCGLQWLRGDILVGAPVISPEEEKRLLKEKRERDKIAEALELERAEKEEEKLKKKAERQGGHHHHHHDISYTSGTFAAQLLQQRSRQRQANIPPAPAAPVAPPVPSNVAGALAPGAAAPPVTAATAAAAAVPPPSGVAPAGSVPVANPASPAVVQQPKTSTTETPKKAPRARKSKAETSAAKKALASAPVAAAASTSATPQQAIQPQAAAPQPPPQQQQTPTQAGPVQAQPQPQSQPAPVPLSLYNPAGIPLPTLSIDFAGHLQFAHPNCGITLLDRDFSVRLCKDGCEQTTVKFEKKDLTNAVFEVVTEGEAVLKREVLKMKIVPATVKKITAFGKTIKIDKKNGVHIRFLEKLDPSGGAVVQRILQRWLVTEPQQWIQQVIKKNLFFFYDILYKCVCVCVCVCACVCSNRYLRLH